MSVQLTVTEAAKINSRALVDFFPFSSVGFRYIVFIIHRFYRLPSGEGSPFDSNSKFNVTC